MRLVIMTIFIILLFSTGSYSKEIKADVVRIIDGSTIVVKTTSGEKTIKISGYKAPSEGQPFFEEAKKTLEIIINNKPVLIKYIYGRDNTAKVTPENHRDIPIIFIVSGLGKTTKEANYSLKKLQEKAKLENKMIWKDHRFADDFKPTKKHQPLQSITIETKTPRSFLYGDSVTNIPRDPDGTAVGDGGNWMFVEKNKRQLNLMPLEIAGEDAPATNSPWDGSVYQVERWLDKNLKDPDSFDAIEWSKVFKTRLPATPYGVRCKYRARNSFGGMDIYRQVFYLDVTGNVAFHEDL